ncbi:MAG: RsmE family RNA methyltransferase, partial [Gammaproteobacteria bacterium]|nr:RsmE family RNA methyltransferase [Gammaproteobacteria bacterium]
SKGERMDFAVQKAVELGVAEITPLFAGRAVVRLDGDRLAKRLDHWQGVMTAACEQSGRRRLARLNPAQPLATRIGIGALMEDLAGKSLARAAIPTLETLTLSAQPQTRADACHYLGLTGDPAVIPSVRRLLDDDDDEVSEIAAETLVLLGDINPGDHRD